MRPGLHWIRSSIFNKLLFTFLLVLIPLYGATYLINQKGNEIIMQEISNSILSRDYYYLNALENELARTMDLLHEYVTDEDLMELALYGDNMSDYERMEAILALQRRMHLMRTSNEFLAEIRVYIPLLSRTFTSDDYDTYIPREEFETLWHRQADYLIDWNDRLFMSMHYPSYPAEGRQPIYVFGVELSKPQLKQYLQSIVNPSVGFAALVHHADGWIIQTNPQGAMTEAMRTHVFRRVGEGRTSGVERVTVDEQKYVLSYRYSEPLSASLIIYVPEQQVLGPLATYRRWIWVLSLVTPVIIVMLAISVYRLIHKPLRRLVGAFAIVEDGYLKQMPQKNGGDEFGYLYDRFNQMISYLRRMIHEVYEQKIISQRAELQRLQSQINPHFLYNCFFVLKQLIRNGQNDTAYDFTAYIANYFQFITRHASDLVPLEQEIHHARAYVEIQQVCYGDRIRVAFEQPDPALADRKVIRLIVQPIVENAFKHAFVQQEVGVLRIRMQAEGDICRITVEDNGADLSEEKLERMRRMLDTPFHAAEETTGMINVHRRLRMHGGEDCGITLSRSELGGLKAEIAVNLQ